MSKKIYLSGPIYGKASFNQAAFFDAAMYVRFKGNNPIVPHELVNDLHYEIEIKPTAFQKMCIAELLLCDEIMMLPGWNADPVATYERSVAIHFEIPVVFYEEEILKARKERTFEML